MKEVTYHLRDSGDKRWRVFAEGDVGNNGAYTAYRVSMQTPGQMEVGANLVIKFQNGPITDKGINGVSDGSLLSAVADHLQDINTKKNCPYREKAADLVRQAISSLEMAADDQSTRLYTVEEVAALLNTKSKV